MLNTPPLFPGTPGLTAAQESYCTCEKSEVSACFHLLGGERKQTCSLLNVLFIRQNPSPEAFSYGLPMCPRVCLPGDIVRGSPEGPVALAASWQGLQALQQSGGPRGTERRWGFRILASGLTAGEQICEREREGLPRVCFAHALLRPGMPFQFSVWPAPTHSPKPSCHLPQMLQAELAPPPWSPLSPEPVHLGTDHVGMALSRQGAPGVRDQDNTPLKAQPRAWHNVRDE